MIPLFKVFSLIIIFKVRTIYSEIRERMSSVEEKLVQYKLVVEHLLKNETSDGANYQVSSCSHLVWWFSANYQLFDVCFFSDAVVVHMVSN